ncbi:insulinase family protein [Fundidesulfovibrio terrae]|uniref:insulinase family protein n=1 Tax=Fundidesulfovibrio terrae TaxID=2922866 RepID=UPI001FAEA0C5|nr:insulinase family protein [Fundidesulfovibrio terrae]
MSAIDAFELVHDGRIDEYSIQARLYRHKRTGAELLSLSCPDENKVFGVSFRTPPADSTGLPHILEHSVLCGSRKYPVKEPFVELLKSSLQTFLNAFTYPDKTCYPVASANLADFHNLVDVYLDAVFHPRIPEEIFGQEGWHYHPKDGGLVFKGVVYNEMKGAYSSPESLLSDQSQRQVFPDVTYGVDSGGDPAHIPSLTYEQFKDFHRRYYHPSNAKFFFYGDDDPASRLEILEEYLKDYDALGIDSEVGLQPRFTEPRRIEAPYACAKPQEGGPAPKAYFTLNWLLPEVRDMEEVLALSVLEHALIGLPGSPLRRALIGSGLGEDLAGGGLETELRQMYFSIGLKGVDPENLPKAEALVLDTLKAVHAAGIDRDAVEAALNTIEFRLRENNTGSFPRGLSLMLRALTTWLHGGDPLAPIRFQAPLDALKAKLVNGSEPLTALLREHFLDNSHRVCVNLLPDPEMSERLVAEEKARLDSAQAALTESGRKKAIDLAARIETFQETPDAPEALAAIPKLHLKDLPTQNKAIPGQWRDGAVFFHDLPTNGVIYLELGFDLAGVSPELLPLVPLFGRALFEMGTDREDFAAFLNRAARKTGGVGREVSLSAVKDAGPGRASSRLILSGKATPDRTGEFLEILCDSMTRANLADETRFKEMLFEAKARAERRIAPSGHVYASRRLKARFHRAALAEERLSGLTGVESLRAWAADFDRSWPWLRDGLQELRNQVLRRDNLQVNVTLDAKNYEAFEPRLGGMLSSLAAGGYSPQDWPSLALPEREGLSAPVQVNFVAQGRDLNELGYTPHGSMLVACRYLRNAYLWERVRVRGGAYGSFCSFDRWSGVLAMLSYRDPNIVKTLDAFAEAGEFLSRLDIPAEELERAIIGTVGDIDSYLLPDAQGHASMARHWAGDSDEARQEVRRQVMNTTLDDLRRAGEVMTKAMHGAPVVVLGSEEGLKDAGKTLKGLEINRAM